MDSAVHHTVPLNQLINKMYLLTKGRVRKLRTLFEAAKGTRVFSEYLTESKIRNSTSTEVTVFLSHKHDEVEVLKDAISFLKEYGVNVYIDHFDDEMPKSTSGITAQKLKTKIKSNKKFIFLATEKSIASKWCNWELGYGDAHKYIDHIALLIFKEDNTDWSGSEYLQIYPTIGATYQALDMDFVVEYPGGKSVSLQKWLNS